VGDDQSPSRTSAPPPEDEIIAPRRSQWLSLKRLAGVAALALVLGGTALILWPLLWAADLDDSVQMVNGRLMGEKWGYVSRIDKEGHTVDVSASLFGWHPVPLVVNSETVITVQDRQGGLGDLWKDMPVRTSYEVVGDKRFAKWIEIVANPSDASAGARPPTAATPASPPAPGASAPSPASSTAERAPAAAPPVTAAPAPAAPSPGRATSDEPARAAKPATASAPTPRTEPPRAAVERPAREAAPPAASVPAPRVEPVRPAVERPTPPATASAPTPRPDASREPAPRRGSEPVEVEITDNTPIIDWLIKESGRR
jgi:hypothetical protein